MVAVWCGKEEDADAAERAASSAAAVVVGHLADGADPPDDLRAADAISSFRPGSTAPCSWRS